MTRRQLRENVFKMLFRVEFHDDKELPEQLILFEDELEPISEDEKIYMTNKYKDIYAHIEELDAAINEVSKGWKTIRMGKVDLTLIRLAVYEIRFEEEIPVKVSINEAVELAKKYGTDDSPAFVNGTDTMEETAYFLNLTVHSDKPVVLVGSMRPSTGISADGPANLYGAVAAAASPNSKGRGVMCCMNNLLLDAKDVIKTHTTDCATFQGGNYGKIGYIYGGEAIYNRQVENLHTTKSEFSVEGLTELPKVGIVYGYSNCSPLPFKAFVDAKYAGIVLAGVGDGNFYKDVFDEALKARQKGILVVRTAIVQIHAFHQPKQTAWNTAQSETTI